MATHYEVLGVASTASQEAVKAAYRRLIRRHHPDVGGDIERARDISEAYRVLSDPDRRAAYDASLAAPPPPPAEPPEPGWGSPADWDTAPPPPPPPPTPPPMPDVWPIADTEEAPVVVRRADAQLPNVLLTGAGSFLVGVLVAALTVRNLDDIGPVLAGGVLLGAFFGWLVYSRWRNRYPAIHSPAITRWWVVCACLIVLALVFLWSSSGQAAVVVTAAAVATTVSLWAAIRRKQKWLNTFVTAQSLLVHNLFGTLPGGVVPDTLDRRLQEILGMNQAARLVRLAEPNRPFTHAVVLGNRVAFVTAVFGPAGSYRWSGPSLLLEQPGQRYAQELIIAPYERVVQETAAVVAGAGGIAQHWLCLMSTGTVGIPNLQDESMPRLVAEVQVVREVAAFLAGAERGVVEHECMVATFRALAEIT